MVVRTILTVVFCIVLLGTLVLSGLAGPGITPFTQSTGNVSDKYSTCITPASFTFSIWGLIYACLVVIALYAISLLFRSIDGRRAWQFDGAVSLAYLLVHSINLALTITWLFVWDAENVTGSAILLLLVAITNVTAISIAAYSFGKGASELYQRSKIDFWMGIFVINGHGFYVTWTILAGLINLTMFFIYEIELIGETVCIAMLSAVLIGFFGWFILENTVFQRSANPLITHYMVVIWASCGIYAALDGTSKAIEGLTIANISVFSSVLFARLVILLVRNWRNKIYGNNLV